MRRGHRVTLTALALLVAAGAAWAGWTRIRSPVSWAREDSYDVWIALLKGFEGDVYYVGSDERYLYFRIGRVFWTYYKLPLCAAQVPEAIAVDRGEPYVVRLRVSSNNTIAGGGSCAGGVDFQPGALDRA
jgi:hypothetical protein